MTNKRITLLVNMQQNNLSVDNLRLEIDDTGSLVLYPHNDEDNFTYARVEKVETLQINGRVCLKSLWIWLNSL